MLILFLNTIFAGNVVVVAGDFIIVTIIIIISIIIIITCNKVANAIKQCSIHLLSVEL